MGQEPNSTGRLRFAKRVVIAGAVVMVVMAVASAYADYHSPIASDKTMRWFGLLGDGLLMVLVLGAIVTLTGYILVSWELPPIKAVFLGIGSIAIAGLTPFLLGPILEAISERFRNSLISHGSVILYGLVLSVFMACGAVAVAVGMIRILLQSWRRS